MALLFIAPTHAATDLPPIESDGPQLRTLVLAPGVIAFIRTEPLGLANNANTVAIIGDSDVVVVDSQFTYSATLSVVGTLLGMTDKPVRYLINTHWHDDHVFGNAVWRGAYPGVTIVAHENTREDLATIGKENRKEQLAGGAGAVAMFESAIKEGKAMDGSPMSPEELAAYRSTVAIARTYLAEAPGHDPPLPDLVFRDRLTLFRGGRTIELRYFGEGVTRGDVVVWLPTERIAITGDLVNAPFPFAYGCHPTSWIAALAGIRELKPAYLVPGHGPLQRDLVALDRLSAALTSIREQAIAAVAGGISEEAFRASVSLDAERAAMAGDDKMMKFLFDAYFAGPAAVAAWREAGGKP
jgi:glyoxylase-like metal-dependent hydrolase (beta-lactamase superfamily II)